MVKMITPAEAEARVPIILKRLALSSIDCMIKLDTCKLNSREIESRILEITGYIGLLNKCVYIVWRAPKPEKKKT
ncbi:unnamed protein product [marine sediment metagenome]|uniref:Uncharacterized protein n=1 Tax=marine sediment metagenome TaxID=412755 RepID=X1TWI2_9ZZZZ